MPRGGHVFAAPVGASIILSTCAASAPLPCSYPGQGGGAAIAQTLFGDGAPGGRLTQTLYPASFIANASFLDYDMAPGANSSFLPSQAYPGRTHR